MRLCAGNGRALAANVAAVSPIVRARERAAVFLLRVVAGYSSLVDNLARFPIGWNHLIEGIAQI